MTPKAEAPRECDVEAKVQEACDSGAIENVDKHGSVVVSTLFQSGRA